MTRIQTTLPVGVVLIIAATIAVKMMFFPSISDKYFEANRGRLTRVPAGLVVVRPTHFGGTPQNRVTYAQVNRKTRAVGVNLTFQMLMAWAYNQNPGRISLPWGAPTNDFDVLMTAAGDPQQLLQAAVRRKLGYTAHEETKDTAVLDLKVENPNAPGLKVSGNDEKQDTSYKSGRLYFTHTRLGEIIQGMEEMVRTPVVDQTGLTNFYDFSLVWDARMQRAMQEGKIDEDTGKKILGDWGLGLEPDTAPVEMLVVEKTK